MPMKRPWMVALLIAACCYGSLALAELTPVDPKTRQDIVFQILAQIANRVTSWEAQVTSAASYLFWTLGTISLAWTMAMMILKRADLGEFFAEFIRFIFFFGLFYALLRQGPNLARLILESMLQLGQEAAGSTIKYQSFISIGTELMSRADQFQQTGASKEDSFLVVGLCGGILLMLTAMVINLFLVFVAGWFLMYAGIFFLGFGGSRWTSDIAIGYYKAVIAVGIQMFVMALIMGIATDVLGDFFEKFSFEMRFYELLSFLVATFAFMTIFNRIPTLLSGLISGASIGISQGELGGALRGANGADPFSAGRTALGTAVGGAQKLMAAVAAGGNQAKAEPPIPQVAKTATEPLSKTTGIAAAVIPAGGKATEMLASRISQGRGDGAERAAPMGSSAEKTAEDGTPGTVPGEEAAQTNVSGENDSRLGIDSSQIAGASSKAPGPSASQKIVDASGEAQSAKGGPTTPAATVPGAAPPSGSQVGMAGTSARNASSPNPGTPRSSLTPEPSNQKLETSAANIGESEPESLTTLS